MRLLSVWQQVLRNHMVGYKEVSNNGCLSTRLVNIELMAAKNPIEKKGYSAYTVKRHKKEDKLK